MISSYDLKTKLSPELGRNIRKNRPLFVDQANLILSGTNSRKPDI